MSRKALKEINHQTAIANTGMSLPGENVNKAELCEMNPPLGRTRSRTQAIKRGAPVDDEGSVKRLKNETELTKVSKREVPELKTSSETEPLKVNKREAPVEDEVSVKRIKTETEDTPKKESDPEPTKENTPDPDATFINYITQVLGKHYFDVGERLNLPSIPECVTNLVKCTQYHSSAGLPAKKFFQFDEYLMQQVGAFVTDGKIEVFYELMSRVVMRGEFPGETLLQLMLETMLAFNDFRHEGLAVLEAGETIFTQVLQKFPPCWDRVRERYLKLMRDPLQLDGFKKWKEYESSQGLFNLLILLLDHHVRNDDIGKRGRNNLTDSLDMNFEKWEEHTKQSYDFSKNAREDRLGRVFRVLKLLVQLMEHDLAIWMLRHPRNVHKGFGNSDKKPLIASVLWPDSRNCDVNFAVKRLMKIFIESVHLNYPGEDLQVLSRLLNLVATCINLAEIRTFKEKNHSVQFPAVNTNTESFAKELKRLIDNDPHFSISLYVDVLKYLRTPCIKAVLANLILARLNPLKEVPKPGRDTPLHALLTSLKHKNWLKMINRPVIPSKVEITEKYPIMSNAPTRKKAFDVFQEDVISIQLVELQSHMEVYRIHDLYNALLASPKDEIKEATNAPQFFTHFNAEMIQKLPKYLDKYKPSEQSLPKADAAQFVFKSISIERDLIMTYREQIKLCFHLQRFIDKAAVKYPELTDFKTYLNKILAK